VYTLSLHDALLFWQNVLLLNVKLSVRHVTGRL
jgi:hypothetical protein